MPSIRCGRWRIDLPERNSVKAKITFVSRVLFEIGPFGELYRLYRGQAEFEEFQHPRRSLCPML